MRSEVFREEIFGLSPLGLEGVKQNGLVVGTSCEWGGAEGGCQEIRSWEYFQVQRQKVEECWAAFTSSIFF